MFSLFQTNLSLSQAKPMAVFARPFFHSFLSLLTPMSALLAVPTIVYPKAQPFNLITPPCPAASTRPMAAPNSTEGLFLRSQQVWVVHCFHSFPVSLSSPHTTCSLSTFSCSLRRHGCTEGHCYLCPPTGPENPLSSLLHGSSGTGTGVLQE